MVEVITGQFAVIGEENVNNNCHSAYFDIFKYVPVIE